MEDFICSNCKTKLNDNLIRVDRVSLKRETYVRFYKEGTEDGIEYETKCDYDEDYQFLYYRCGNCSKIYKELPFKI